MSRPPADAIRAERWGRKAAESGVARERCPYRLAAIRSAWYRGWDERTRELADD